VRRSLVCWKECSRSYSAKTGSTDGAHRAYLRRALRRSLN
jgi:hypothetical protein